MLGLSHDQDQALSWTGMNCHSLGINHVSHSIAVVGSHVCFNQALLTKRNAYESLLKSFSFLFQLKIYFLGSDLY